jgi:hypothetical protein
MEVVSMILTVAQKIVMAAETARQNKDKCLELAERAGVISEILRADRDATLHAAGGGAPTAAPPPGPLTDTARIRKDPLDRLHAALSEALELVESCHRCWLISILCSGRTATRFQDVDRRITNCLTDLHLAERVADRLRARHANSRGTGSVHCASLLPYRSRIIP